MNANEPFESDRVVLKWGDFTEAFEIAKTIVAQKWGSLVTEEESDWLALRLVSTWLKEAIYNAVSREGLEANEITKWYGWFGV